MSDVRTKVTLEGQIHRLRWLSGKLLAGSVVGGSARDAMECDAAVDTLRRLLKDGGKLLHQHLGPGLRAVCECCGCLLARSLGVEPKS